MPSDHPTPGDSARAATPAGDPAEPMATAVDAPAVDALAEYRQKRDFTQTAEPAGGTAPPNPEQPFFCVQKHAASALHYDVRLEAGGVLKSWAVPKGPSPDPAEKRLAVKVEDHPLEYGSFEGSIPTGEYGAGTVLLWDRGWWEPDRARTKDPSVDPETSLAAGELKVVFHGEKLQGSWTLVQMKGRGAKNWLLIKHRDEHARPGYDLTGEAPLSVSTGRTIEEIAADAESGAGRLEDAAVTQGGPSSAGADTGQLDAPDTRAQGPGSEQPGAG